MSFRYLCGSFMCASIKKKQRISSEVDQWMYSKFYPATGKKSESLMEKYLLCEKGSKCFFTQGVHSSIFLRRAKFEESNIF